MVERHDWGAGLVGFREGLGANWPAGKVSKKLRLAGEEPALHSALRHARGRALPRDDQHGSGQGGAPPRQHGQGPRQDLPAAAGCPCRPARTAGDRVDEIAIRKGHDYRIVVSDLDRRRPISVGGKGRTEADMDLFFATLGAKKTARIQLAAMDMWKPFRTSLRRHAPQARVIFDKFHILRHLGDALDTVRRREYRRLAER